MRTAMLNFIFITILSFTNSMLTYITRPSRATVGFTDRLAVRAEVLLRLRAPVNAAGVFVLLLPLVIHFLATHVAAGNFRFGSGSFRRFHKFNARRQPVCVG